MGEIRAEAVNRTVAIAAMLRSAIDRGSDYIEMCVPILMSSVASSGKSDFSINELKALVDTAIVADVPSAVVNTIANRCVKRRYLRRDGGRWISDRKFEAAGQNATEIEANWLSLVDEFLKYSSKKGVTISARDAGDLLVRVVQENRVGLIVENLSAVAEKNAPTGAESALVGQFILDVVAQREDLLSYIKPVVAGLVLRSTLLLGDTISSQKRLRGLTVYLDSRLVFAALDVGDPDECAAVKQGLLLLKSNGATLRVFDKTLDEMKRVLAIYEKHLATPNGVKALYKTPLTDHFLRVHATPADVAVFAIALERRLVSHGIRNVQTPSRMESHTLDEKELQKILSSGGSVQFERRVEHDIDCVAAVLTMRRGKVRRYVQDTDYVFSTLSWLTAKHIGEWYRTQDEGGFPPCAHQSLLTTIAWLSNPQAGDAFLEAGIKSIAAMGSTLNAEAWSRFKSHLQKMVAGGDITPDEELALLASRMAQVSIIEEALGRGDDPDAPDTTTIADAVARVRNDQDRRVIEAKEETTKARQDLAVRDAKASLFALKCGKVASWVVFWILVSLCVVGWCLAIPKANGLIIGFTSLISLVVLILGADVRGWRVSFAQYLARKIRGLLPA